MTASVFVVCLLVGSAAAVVNLDCNDNATCIESLTRDLVRNLRARRAVKLFDAVTIEPVSSRQARSSEGLWKFIEGHAVSFDWNDFTFRLSVPKDGRDDALELEMLEGRTAKDVSDTNSKKSSSKVEDEQEEDKAPKLGLRRRQKKKVFQALVPLLFGMKSAGVVIFAFAVVSALTIKAFVASKLALLVTIGMAVKKLYESYSTGLPETSNVLWSITRFFKVLFGFPAIPPLSHEQTMTIPMYVMPQMQMYGPPMTMPPNPMAMT